MPVRVAIFTGLALAQIGEFSFVLAKSGLGTNLIGTGPYQTFLASAIITMALTPFTMNAAPLLTGLLHRLFPDRIPLENNTGSGEEMTRENLCNHIIIVGYGLTGRSVARAAEIAGIPFIAIDLDPEVVRTEQKNNPAGQILYGDATHGEILAHAGIVQARALVVTIPEHNLVPGIVHMAREAAPGCYLIVRTRYVSEVQHLLELGANEVIPEEFETSVQAFSRVLAKYTLSGGDTALLAEKIRCNGYQRFMRDTATLPEAGKTLPEVTGDLNIHTLRISATDRAAGRTLGELDAESNHRVRILAVRRGAATITTLQTELVLQAEDFLVLHATGPDLVKFRNQVTDR